MYLLMMFSIIFSIVSFIMMFTASMLSKKNNMDLEKNSPFECGFDPKTSSRTPFSLRFFLISMIFIIFDIEIALLLPSIYTFNISNSIIWLSSMIFFILILLIGTFHEWQQGALEWA